MGGLSRRYVKVMEMKNEGKNPIILDAGDFFFSTTKLNKNNIESEEYRAGAILEGYNRIGCDAINIGKYELLNGSSFLKKMSNMTEIPFLSANLKDSKTKELLFEPYKIIKRGEVSFGVIVITSLLPDTSTTIISDDYIQSGNNYINELSGKTDVIIMLVNTDRKSQNELAGVFNNADFIITSGSTNLTRTNATQKDGGPYMFSCGKQGKYLMVIDAEMKDEKLPFVNISNHEKKINNVKMYDLARKQIFVRLKPTQVMIENIKLVDFTDDCAAIEVECKKGTYKHPTKYCCSNSQSTTFTSPRAYISNQQRYHRNHSRK